MLACSLMSNENATIPERPQRRIGAVPAKVITAELTAFASRS
jgi:hypothetical protein